MDQGNAFTCNLSSAPYLANMSPHSSHSTDAHLSYGSLHSYVQNVHWNKPSDRKMRRMQFGVNDRGPLPKYVRLGRLAGDCNLKGTRREANITLVHLGSGRNCPEPVGG